VRCSTEGWSLGRVDAVEWSPWGSTGDARAKILADGDGYDVSLVEAEPGYSGDAHAHAFTEFLFVVDGALQTQGETLSEGSASVAAAGSMQEQFAAPDDATYLSIVKL
jgi:quercetin dioxygenase-like cupin family protein